MLRLASVKLVSARLVTDAEVNVAVVPDSVVIAPEIPRIVAEAVVPIVVPVMVVISADVPVRVVIAPDIPRIVAEAVVPIVVPVIVVISADVPVSVVIVADVAFRCVI
jgi:hypothetical protein